VRIFYTDRYVLPLPPGHRFPMEKYAMLRQRVEDAGLAGKDGLTLPAGGDRRAAPAGA